MLPKTIHYCWFGNKPLHEEALKCINSWRKFFPDYEIIEWNESNFDLNKCTYIKEAYMQKKWAFVSDYARFWILYNYGGIYFDTDVEVISSMNDIVSKGQFMGCEHDVENKRLYRDTIVINSGLGLGLEAKNSLCKEILDNYERASFLKNDGTLDLENNVVSRVTRIFSQYGFDKKTNDIQEVKGITLYPVDYFCPLNYYTNELKITENTRSIHHYSASWLNCWEKKIETINIKYHRNRIITFFCTFPLKVLNKIYTLGVGKTLKFMIHKLFH